jgi:[glutamine synthetase] adenylyltransferase / [glutamine synthetase]-adenylyl-L-tyrosine phosphorylase
VQMQADAQTHQLPDSVEQCERFANALGYAQWQDFFNQLQQHRDIVEQLFTDLLNASEQQAVAVPAVGAEITHEYLQSLGFMQYTRHAERLQALLESSSASALSDKSQQRMLRVAHQFSQLCAHASNADLCLEDVVSFLQSIVKRSSYIALLDEQPTALKRMVQVFDNSQWLSQQLINYPLLLDELLDARIMDQRFDSAHLSEQIHACLGQHTEDIELALLALNDFNNYQPQWQASC